MTETKGSILSIPLDDELDNMVRKRAAEQKMSMADVGRQALLRYLEEEK